MTIQTDVTRELVQTTVDEHAKQILDVMWSEVARTNRPELRGYNIRFLVNPSIMAVLRNIHYGKQVNPVDIVDGHEYIFGIPVTQVPNYKPWQLVVEVEWQSVN